MPEVRLIDANALLKDLRSDCPESDVCIAETSCIECIIGRQPTIEAEPVRHGQWEYDDVNDLDYCSECNTGMNGNFPFCPYCGAKMDGGAENG